MVPAGVTTKTQPTRPRARVKPSPIAQPEFVPPMQAKLVNALPEGPDWLYEIKWDGYRL